MTKQKGAGYRRKGGAAWAEQQKKKAWKAAKTEAEAQDTTGEDEEPRFASLYYGGTFDEDLNELAVDTESLWQGYYPSMYNPLTQEAAEHQAAPVSDGTTWQGRGDRDWGRDGGRRWGGGRDWGDGDMFQRIAQYFNIDDWENWRDQVGWEGWDRDWGDNRRSWQDMGDEGRFGWRGRGDDRRGGRDHRGRDGWRDRNRPLPMDNRTISTEEVFRPDVSENEEIVPWRPAQWMVSMGQWRGT